MVALGKRCFAASRITLVTATSAPSVTRDSTKMFWMAAGSRSRTRISRTRSYRASRCVAWRPVRRAMTSQNSSEYTRQRRGSNRSAKRSTTTRNSARSPPACANKSSSKCSGHGREAKQCCNRSCAICSAEIFSNQELQLLARRHGHGLRIGDQCVSERRSAFAFASFRHARDGGRHHLTSIVGILLKILQNVSHGDGVVLFVPAIVIGHHRDGHVTKLGFARELGLLQIGHANHVHAPTAIHVRFGFRRKRGPFHAQIRSAACHMDAGLNTSIMHYLGKLRAHWIGEADVR